MTNAVLFSTFILNAFLLLPSAPAEETDGIFETKDISVHLVPKTGRFLYLIVRDKSMMARGETALAIREQTPEGTPLAFHMPVPIIQARGLLVRSMPVERKRRLILDQHIYTMDNGIAWNIHLKNRGSESAEVEFMFAFPFLMDGWQFFEGTIKRKEVNELKPFTEGQHPFITVFDRTHGLGLVIPAGARIEGALIGAKKFPGMWKLVYRWPWSVPAGDSRAGRFVLFGFNPEKGARSALDRYQAFGSSNVKK